MILEFASPSACHALFKNYMTTSILHVYNLSLYHLEINLCPILELYLLTLNGDKKTVDFIIVLKIIVSSLFERSL